MPSIHSNGQAAIYDIGLFFIQSPIVNPDCCQILLFTFNQIIDTISNKDVTLQEIGLGDNEVKTTVHKASTVSVIVACTVNPIPIDMFGLVKLSSNCLAMVEDRLQLLVDEYNESSVQEMIYITIIDWNEEIE